MDNNITNKAICLQLNANWLPVGYKTVQAAIIDLCGSESSGKPTSLAVDIDYDVDANGSPLLENPKSMIPVRWSDWINLPVRSWDLAIHTQKRAIRVPTVIIATKFEEMPLKKFGKNPSNSELFNRDNGICQYTGRKLARHEATKDHILPKSRGGSDTWENMVTCAKDINLKKGNKLNNEVGLKLLRKPFMPKPIPLCATIQDAKHVDWQHFLIKK